MQRKPISLFKKCFRHCCFPDSYLKFSTTFLMSIVIRKKKRGSDIYRKSNYASFDLTSPRFLLLRDVFETSQRSHGKYIFFEICSRCLKDVTEKTYFLRCIWDVLKMSQKSHLLWDVSKSSPRCLSQWRSDWDLSETSHAYWVRDSSRTRSRYFTCF